MTRIPPGQSNEAGRRRSCSLPAQRRHSGQASSRSCRSSGFYNQRISNVLLAPITSNLARRLDPAHYLIDVSTAEGRQSGLHQDSLVSCLNVGVVPVALVGPKIGELPALAMEKVDDCLKAALGIS